MGIKSEIERLLKKIEKKERGNRERIKYRVEGLYEKKVKGKKSRRR